MSGQAKAQALSSSVGAGRGLFREAPFQAVRLEDPQSRKSGDVMKARPMVHSVSRCRPGRSPGACDGVLPRAGPRRPDQHCFSMLVSLHRAAEFDVVAYSGYEVRAERRRITPAFKRAADRSIKAIASSDLASSSVDRSLRRSGPGCARRVIQRSSLENMKEPAPWRVE